MLQIMGNLNICVSTIGDLTLNMTIILKKSITFLMVVKAEYEMQFLPKIVCQTLPERTIDMPWCFIQR